MSLCNVTAYLVEMPSLNVTTLPPGVRSLVTGARYSATHPRERGLAGSPMDRYHTTSRRCGSYVTKITLQNHVQRIRRRPAPDAKVAGPAQMPETWHEFTGRELGAVLGVSPRDAEEMLDLARLLEVNLPGIRAAFRAGILSREKAALIAWATALLDPAEARKAEAMVLGRAGPGR